MVLEFVDDSVGESSEVLVEPAAPARSEDVDLGEDSVVHLPKVAKGDRPMRASEKWDDLKYPRSIHPSLKRERGRF